MTTPAHLFEWRPFLAPFHAVVLHYPIGFLTMAFLLEIYRMRRPSDEARRITTWVIALSLLTGLISATLGIMRAGSGGYEAHNLDLHRWFGMSVPFLTLLTLWLQIRASKRPESAARLMAWTYRLSLTTTLVVLVIAGHYGGNLTHGSKYLVENAPEFIKTLLEEEPAELASTPADPTNAAPIAVVDPGAVFYREKIQPVFETKCVRCHGPEKQKGKYRLDRREYALKPGESGAEAIKPKEPFQSHLVKLIFLPPDHDEVMPPSGKEPLTPQEIIHVVQWIQMGAPFDTPPVAQTP